MATEKIACWNIYFSWQLVSRSGSAFRFPTKQRKRADNVGAIINAMDAGILGIVECMSPHALKFFRDQKLPQYGGLVLNGDGEKYNIGLLYKDDLFSVAKQRISTSRWKAKIGNDRSPRFYKFTRPPLVVNVTHKPTRRSLLVSVLHTKSKRPSDKLTKQQQEREAVQNRKRIVAEGMRLRELLFQKAKALGVDRFLVMGDINDGPDFDRYEKQIFRSGIESLLGSVLDPEKILYSFVDLSDGRGQPSSSFAKGSVQLDHIVYTQSMHYGRALPKVVKSSGSVRSDLVNIKRDGKRRDSDHAPVEVKVRF